ncbi:unnamed protein product [Symbiodinium sp. KB8]|nr:unnamed protein product [Symbiodinium sp. KB8]
MPGPVKAALSKLLPRQGKLLLNSNSSAAQESLQALLAGHDQGLHRRVSRSDSEIRQVFQGPIATKRQLVREQQDARETEEEASSDANRFTSLITCVLIANCRDKATCLAGLSDGTIGILPMKAEMGSGSAGQVLPLVRHTAGVVAMALDETEQHLFSASSDKAIMVFDLRRQMIQCEVSAPSPPTHMIHCQDMACSAMRHSLFVALLVLLTASATVVEVESSLPVDECADLSDELSGCALSALQLKTQKHLSDSDLPGSFSVALSTEDGKGHVTGGEQAKHQQPKPKEPQHPASQNRQPQLLDVSRRSAAACCQCASGEVGFSASGGCSFCQGDVRRTENAPQSCHLSLIDAAARTQCAQQCGRQFRRKSWYPEGLNF